ncbi:lytic transglycosylase domain-containing protein [Bdellovibrio sp. SKB1291214]|uniref:transglycosylase SLT domain-containing protein n=1 Tax=Bdellovibrio sp. SKB1291214 TaxID=1732569 RepID=UPI001130EA2B|nr:transglycosylase SLT domain-containing protein [Bdellovibrio sp. SKB1291214]UYL08865.1 lytic transglycosylase domain-containing protein [Bdellovibrio sp. SKB1291214]
MNISAYLLKASLFATCGIMMIASSDNHLFEVTELASKTDKYVEKIYPLEIIDKTPAKKTQTAVKAKTVSVKKANLPTQAATVSKKPPVSKDATASLNTNAVKQVEKMNKVNEILAYSKGDKNETVACTNCSVASEVASMRFNQCSDKDDYLEEALERKKLSRSYLGALIRTPISKKPMVRPVCIETAMFLQSPSSGPVVNYKTCSGGNAKNAPARPCVSEKYFTLVNNTFEVVSQCMKTYIGEGESAAAQKQNILAVFGMISVESGFHINITSKTGAGGIGQFTSPAINAVNKMISETEEFLLTHPDSRCQKLATEFLKEDKLMSSGKTCDRVSINEGNPVTNMIYTYAALKEAKDYFDSSVFDDEKMKAKFALSSNEMAKIKRATMIWSHNTGYAGLKTPLTKLLTTKYAKKKVTNADTFLEELKEYARTYPNKGNAGSKARIKETAGYYAKIQTKIDLVEHGAAGGSCLN